MNHEHEGIEHARSFLADSRGQGYRTDRLTCPGCLVQVRLSGEVDCTVMEAVIASVAGELVTTRDGQVMALHEDSSARLLVSAYVNARVHLALHEGKVVGIHPAD